MEEQKKIFVAIPFRMKKGRLNHLDEDDEFLQIDFDQVWKNLIFKVLPQDKYLVKRADHVNGVAVIDEGYLKWLFEADLVIADITFGNANVFYELGIRQALSGKGTILIGCKGSVLPFDIQGQKVINYDYSVDADNRYFKDKLLSAVDLAITHEPGSPVNLFLPELLVTTKTNYREKLDELNALKQEIVILKALSDDHSRFLEKVNLSKSQNELKRIYEDIMGLAQPKLQLVDRYAEVLLKYDCYDLCINLLTKYIDLYPRDSYLKTHLGLAYKRKGEEYYGQAKRYLFEAIEINPSYSETYGILGGLLKLKGEYVNALGYYKKCNELDTSNLYAMINLGAVNLLAGNNDSGLSWYEKTKTQANQILTIKPDDVWAVLCLIESLAVLNQREEVFSALEKSEEIQIPMGDLNSMKSQLRLLENHLEHSELVDIVLSRL